MSYVGGQTAFHVPEQNFFLPKAHAQRQLKWRVPTRLKWMFSKTNFPQHAPLVPKLVAYNM